jgi:lycopene cyclase domain-containing protein
MKGEYMIVLVSIALFPLVLSRDRNIGLYDHVGALVKSMAVVCVVFWLWDIVATARGHWSFNPGYVMGCRLLGMPVEEWLFFVVVTFVSVFTWESTKYFVTRKKK